MFKKEAVYYDLFHTDKDYKKEAEDLKKTYRNVKTILEIGSGTGLMTKELMKLGFHVTCIEPSTEMMKIAKQNNRKGDVMVNTTIQDFESNKRYDLVLTLYDVLNYIPFNEYYQVVNKIMSLTNKFFSTQEWSNDSVKLFTHKKVEDCHRVRIGFKLFKRVYLWFIFWGRGLCIEFHKLYIHE